MLERLAMIRRKRTDNSPFVPSGLIAKTEKGYYYVKGDKRYKLVSSRAAQSWGLKVINTLESTIKDIKTCGILGFRDGTLIRDISNQKIYLVSDNKKRNISDPDFFKVFPYGKNDIIMVSSKEAACHKEGEPISVY
jgi:hypothetical protein